MPVLLFCPRYWLFSLSTNWGKDQSNDVTQWISARPKALQALPKLLGKCEFRAKCGIVTGANGAYWVRVVQKASDLTVQNVPEVVKFKKRYDIAAVESKIEPDLVWDLIRGSDIRRWSYSTEFSIIVPQDPIKREPISLALMQKKYPKTLTYFENFNIVLKNRPSHVFKQTGGHPFYAMFGISEDTFSTDKVVFRKIGEQMIACAVLSQPGKKTQIADQSLNIIRTKSKDEAFYLASLLNSTPIRWYISATATRNVPSQIISDIRLPRFDARNELHQDLAHLSDQCHKKATAGISVTDLEEQIDDLAAELWGLTKEELKEIKQSLEELK